jgi:photosystem II stability/assembly factor-like uncharacterized protein
MTKVVLVLIVLVLSTSFGYRAKSQSEYLSQSTSRRNANSQSRNTAVSLKIAQSPTQTATDYSDAKITLNVITVDKQGNIWAGGAYTMAEGFLLRANAEDVKVIMLPSISNEVSDLLFTSPRTGWLIGDWWYLYRTTDGGNNWEKIWMDERLRNAQKPTRLNSICFADEEHGWVAGASGLIYNTEDGGKTWRKQKSGANIDLKKIQFVDASHGWAIGNNSGLDADSILIATSNGGLNWNTLLKGSVLTVKDLKFVSTDKGWGINQRGDILYTSNGGRTWLTQRQNNGEYLSTVLFFNELDGLAMGDIILRTANGGRTWEYQNKLTFFVEPRYIAFTDRLHGWAIHPNGVRISDLKRTINGGQTWELISAAWQESVDRNAYKKAFGEK